MAFIQGVGGSSSPVGSAFVQFTGARSRWPEARGLSYEHPAWARWAFGCAFSGVLVLSGRSWTDLDLVAFLSADRWLESDESGLAELITGAELGW